MANLLPLTYYPSEVLRAKARELTKEEIQSPAIARLILDMEKTMHENDGIGLAAPQVNSSVRLVIINTDQGILPLINPVIRRRSWKKEIMEEGCLSIPGVYGMVKRPIKIKVRALNAEGVPINFEASGMFARVIQHEVDHINGVLFIDSALEITQGADKLKKMNPGAHG